MKTQVYFGIVLGIIILFAVGMAGTYIPDHLRGFFGDQPSDREYGFDASYSWGIRHYWYFWMMIFLFLLSVVNVVVSIINLIKKHYPGL